MIIIFKFRPNCWHDLDVLTSGKSFMTFDVDFKHCG